MKRIGTSRRPRRIAVLAVLAWFLTPSASFAATETPAAAEASAVSEEKLIPLAALLDRKLDADDKRRLEVVRESLSATGAGVGAFVGTRGIHLLDHRDLYLKGLKKNLTINMRRFDAETAGEAIRQAEAVFDPVFTLNLGRTVSRTYQRRHLGAVYLYKFNPNDQEDGVSGITLVDTTDPSAQIDKIAYNSQVASLVEEDIYFSSAQNEGDNMTFNGALTIGQQLPWGPTIDLTTTLSYHNAEYSPDGRKEDYDAPWATSWAANLWIPIVRGFGEDAPGKISVAQAKIADDLGSLDLKTTINAVLLNIDHAYWDLVGAVEGLANAVDNRRIVLEREAQSERLLKAGRTTKYENAQVQSEAVRARVMEEAARGTLVTASNALGAMIENDWNVMGRTMFLPVAYGERLETELPVEVEKVVATGLERRPELAAAAKNIESSALGERLAANQALPDISVSSSLSQGQDNSTYGYKSIVQSISQLKQPDSQSYSVTANYRRPWKNRMAKTALTQARNMQEQAGISRDAMQFRVKREINDALSALFSARDRLRTAEEHVHLAAKTYEKLTHRAETRGDVPELELMQKIRDVNVAKHALTAAKIAHKKGESSLLAAQGTIAETTAYASASDAFGRGRLQTLAENGALSFFAAPEVDAKIVDAKMIDAKVADAKIADAGKVQP